MLNRVSIMKVYYHGDRQRGPYFEGWYFKLQTAEGRSLALIPALHMDVRGRRTASLQVIADRGTWWLEYPAGALHVRKSLFQIRLDHNLFNSRGLWLNLEEAGLSLRGTVAFGPFTPLKSDIMGPFRFLPGMECAHGVISMGHSLEGALTLNGERLDFTGGTGYVETDRGRSFPSAFLWAQCGWQEGDGRTSLMLSVASIPLAALRFTGCICEVRHAGRSWRLATYRGAVVEQWGENGAIIRQGEVRLEVGLVDKRTQPLQAPAAGEMSRTVHESLCTVVRYRFWDRSRLLFDHTDDRAGYEYADEPV